MYSLLIKPILFSLDAEYSHDLTLSNLNRIPSIFFPKTIHAPYECMGLNFPNRVGLAAGLDKNGAYIDALAKLGFGFIEIGTITPRPQAGNPKPRLFRIPSKKVIINRMGFNNEGVDALISNVKRAKFDGVLGINIGKNKETPLDKAADDYIFCMNKVYTHASYITINISSPNTPDLRKLQQADYLHNFIAEIKDQHLRLADKHKAYKPLVVKMSPDESEETMQAIAESLLKNNIDGLIATNTTCSRQGLTDEHNKDEAGGMSGELLASKSSTVIRMMHEFLDDKIPIIGVGGIVDVDYAKQKIDAGAKLVQIYSGLIYQGPSLVTKIASALS
jgi:dihydroorotate dehydrogenase